MKRGALILVFIALFFLLSYSPPKNNLEMNTLGVNCGGVPATTTEEVFEDIPESCIPLSTPGLIDLSEKSEDEAVFFYENIPFVDMIFEVNSQSAIVKRGESNYPAVAPILVEGTNNCKYYLFAYKRYRKTFSYNLQYKSRRSDGMCVYDITPITDDTDEILALGGESGRMIYNLAIAFANSESGIVKLKEICIDTTIPTINTNQNCPTTQRCAFTIEAGPQEYYEYSYEVDECGNALVGETNNGLPTDENGVNERASAFIEECTANQEVNLCGNEIINEGEECDGLNFGEYYNGTDKCKDYDSSRYTSGDLQCEPAMLGGRSERENSNGCKIKLDDCGNLCGNGIIDEGEECDDGNKENEDGCDNNCKVKIPDYCLTGGNNPPGIIFYPACLEFKNKFGLNKTDPSEYDCQNIVNEQIAKKQNGADCRYYANGGRYPEKPLDDDNWVWGICFNGICGQEKITLNILKNRDNTYCSCQCYDANAKTYSVGWNDFCKFTDTDGVFTKVGEPNSEAMCIKKSGKISAMSGKNICNINENVVCNDKSDVYKKLNPKIAKSRCEANQNKIFYSEFSIMSGTKCLCVNKEITLLS